MTSDVCDDGMQGGRRGGDPRAPEIVEPAAAALELVGLVERRADVVRSTFAASYFEYLWPVLL